MGGRLLVKLLSKTTGWMPADIRPVTLNLRVVGSIPTRLTSLRSSEPERASAGEPTSSPVHGDHNLLVLGSTFTTLSVDSTAHRSFTTLSV
jgi:hypothetical protein